MVCFFSVGHNCQDIILINGVAEAPCQLVLFHMAHLVGLVLKI